MNKRADSRLLSPWLFLVLSIIGISIVLGVWLFYSRETDIRFAESRAISNKLITVVAENGYLNEDILRGDLSVFELMYKAGLEKTKFERGGDLYFNLTITELVEGREIPRRFFPAGEIDFEKQCRLPGNLLAKCVNEKLVLLNKTNLKQQFIVRILAGSNQKVKAV
jgi:hypothetical protein